jgi:hypothetical protein
VYSTLRESLGAGKKRELIMGNWEFKDPSSQALPIRATDSDLRQCSHQTNVERASRYRSGINFL